MTGSIPGDRRVFLSFSLWKLFVWSFFPTFLSKSSNTLKTHEFHFHLTCGHWTLEPVSRNQCFPYLDWHYLWSRHGFLCFVTSGYRSVMGLSVCFLQQGNDLHRPAAQMSRTRDQKPSMRSVWREDGHLSLEVTATQEGVMLWGSAVETFQNTPWRFWNVGCMSIATMLTRVMLRKWHFPRRQILQCCR